MLYVTTRDNRDAYTAHRALWQDRAPDGGLLLPLRLPVFSPEEVALLAEKSFGQRVAEVTNRLFDSKLTGWDVDFCIGRYPARIAHLRHRILLAEIWHNPQSSYDWLVSNLLNLLMKNKAVPGNWAKIAVRIAVLFGIYGELRKQGIVTADIAVVSGDFSAPISAWYARKMGLPFENIIICCNENNAIWDLVCHGQMRTDMQSKATNTPDADVVVPENLERLIFSCGSYEEVQRYLQACREGKSYIPSANVLTEMRNGLSVSVVGSDRIESTISGVFRTHGYAVSPYTALAYAGLLDYRTKTGQTRQAMVLAEKSSLSDAETVAKALRMPTDDLKRWIAQN